MSPQPLVHEETSSNASLCSEVNTILSENTIREHSSSETATNDSSVVLMPSINLESSLSTSNSEILLLTTEASSVANTLAPSTKSPERSTSNMTTKNNPKKRYKKTTLNNARKLAKNTYAARMQKIMQGSEDRSKQYNSILKEVSTVTQNNSQEHCAILSHRDIPSDVSQISTHQTNITASPFNEDLHTQQVVSSDDDVDSMSISTNVSTNDLSSLSTNSVSPTLSNNSVSPINIITVDNPPLPVSNFTMVNNIDSLEADLRETQELETSRSKNIADDVLRNTISHKNITDLLDDCESAFKSSIYFFSRSEYLKQRLHKMSDHQCKNMFEKIHAESLQVIMPLLICGGFSGESIVKDALYDLLMFSLSALNAIEDTQKKVSLFNKDTILSLVIKECFGKKLEASIFKDLFNSKQLATKIFEQIVSATFLLAINIFYFMDSGNYRINYRPSNNDVIFEESILEECLDYKNSTLATLLRKYSDYGSHITKEGILFLEERIEELDHNAIQASMHLLKICSNNTNGIYMPIIKSLLENNKNILCKDIDNAILMIRTDV